MSSRAASNHPSSAVLLDHVNGSLGVAHDRVVATHVLACPTCQEEVSFCEDIGTFLLTGRKSVEAPAGLLERCLGSIASEEPPRRHRGAAGEPETPYRIGGTVLPLSLVGLDPGRLRWLAPGVRHSTLWQDHRSTLHFISVDPGVTLPAHRHRGLELTCVLSGAFHDNGTRYEMGDISEEDDDDDDDDNRRRDQDHLVVADRPEACVCIMATTGRLRFSGWMARLLQPVMPF